MGRLAAIAAACLWVAACAGTVKEGMTRLQGQPLSVVIAKIGLPTDERTVAGKKVYIWGTRPKNRRRNRAKRNARSRQR
jgi:hypothetical protein